MLYAFIDTSVPAPIPPRQVNGGLYTGEPAHGPWGNVPVEPSQYGMSKNLLSANPPPNAEKMMVAPRLGNNPDELSAYYQVYSTTNQTVYCRK
jgi:hypothetical protein